MTQATQHTRLPAPFVLVTGGKGGVGKTTIAAHLGVHVARRDLRVLIVDLDLGLADLDVVMGLNAAHHLEDALDGRCEFEDCIIPGPGGTHVLPASSGSEAMGNLGDDRRAKLVDGLARAARGFDLVVGDSAAGIGPDVLTFAGLADRVLVVTTPDVAALTDAYGLIKALDQFGARTQSDIPTPEVVVNLTTGVEQGQAIAHKLRTVCERFLSRSPRQAGWLPSSESLKCAFSGPGGSQIRRRKSLENLCLRQMAERLSRLAGGLPLVNRS